MFLHITICNIPATRGCYLQSLREANLHAIAPSKLRLRLLFCFGAFLQIKLRDSFL